MNQQTPPAAVLQQFGRWLQQWADFTMAQATLVESSVDEEIRPSERPVPLSGADSDGPPAHWLADQGEVEGPPAHWLALLREHDAEWLLDVTGERAEQIAAPEQLDDDDLPPLMPPGEWLPEFRQGFLFFLKEFGFTWPEETGDAAQDAKAEGEQTAEVPIESGVFVPPDPTSPADTALPLPAAPGERRHGERPERESRERESVVQPAEAVKQPDQPSARIPETAVTGERPVPQQPAAPEKRLQPNDFSDPAPSPAAPFNTIKDVEAERPQPTRRAVSQPPRPRPINEAASPEERLQRLPLTQPDSDETLVETQVIAPSAGEPVLTEATKSAERPTSPTAAVEEQAPTTAWERTKRPAKNVLRFSPPAAPVPVPSSQPRQVQEKSVQKVETTKRGHDRQEAPKPFLPVEETVRPETPLAAATPVIQRQTATPLPTTETAVSPARNVTKLQLRYSPPPESPHRKETAEPSAGAVAEANLQPQAKQFAGGERPRFERPVTRQPAEIDYQPPVVKATKKGTGRQRVTQLKPSTEGQLRPQADLAPTQPPPQTLHPAPQDVGERRPFWMWEVPGSERPQTARQPEQIAQPDKAAMGAAKMPNREISPLRKDENIKNIQPPQSSRQDPWPELPKAPKLINPGRGRRRDSSRRRRLDNEQRGKRWNG